MKQLIIKVFTVCMMAVVLAGCDKVIDVDNEMSATIGGESFNALATVGVLESGLILVTGTSVEDNLVVALNDDIAEGEYNMLSGEAYITYAEPNSSFTVTTQGTVNVTSHDVDNKIVEGTFSGIIRSELDSASSIEVTNGKFVSSYKSVK